MNHDRRGSVRQPCHREQQSKWHNNLFFALSRLPDEQHQEWNKTACQQFREGTAPVNDHQMVRIDCIEYSGEDRIALIEPLPRQQ